MVQPRFDHLDKVEFRRSDIADPPWETGMIVYVNSGPEYAYEVSHDWNIELASDNAFYCPVADRYYYHVVEDTDRQIRFLSDQEYEEKICGEFLKYLSNREVKYIGIDEYVERQAMTYSTVCGETRSIDMHDSTNGIATVMGSTLLNQRHHGIKAAWIRLDEMRWTNNAFGTLVDGLLSSQDLKELDLCDSGCGSESVAVNTRRLQTMVERIREKRSLQTLRLHDCCVPCLAGFETFLHELEFRECFLKRARHTGTLIQTEDFPMSRFKCIFDVSADSDGMPDPGTFFRFPKDFYCLFQNNYLTSLNIQEISNKVCSGLGRMLRTTRALKELKLGVTKRRRLKNIITAMQTNESVEELSLSFLYVSFYTKSARILANGLVCFQKVRCIDIVGAFKPINDSIMKTMQSILAEKIYVERLTWNESNTSNEVKAQVELFCRVNRRLNEPDLAKLLKCPSKIPLELWPYLLASVSLKASGLFSMLSCYPSLVDEKTPLKLWPHLLASPHEASDVFSLLSTYPRLFRFAVAKAKENKLKEDIKFWKRIFAWSLFNAIVLPP